MDKEQKAVVREFIYFVLATGQLSGKDMGFLEEMGIEFDKHYSEMINKGG